MVDFGPNIDVVSLISLEGWVNPTWVEKPAVEWIICGVIGTLVLDVVGGMVLEMDCGENGEDGDDGCCCWRR